MFHSFHGLMNSINWPASSIWVFIAQLGEHCSGRRGHGFESRWSPEKLFFGLFSQLLKLRFTAMVTYSFHLTCIPAVHIISISVSFLSRVDELNKLASLQYMGLHSSAGRALQRSQRPRVRIPLEPRKTFFRAIFAIA